MLTGNWFVIIIRWRRKINYTSTLFLFVYLHILISFRFKFVHWIISYIISNTIFLSANVLICNVLQSFINLISKKLCEEKKLWYYGSLYMYRMMMVLFKTKIANSWNKRTDSRMAMKKITKITMSYIGSVHPLLESNID